MASLSIFALLPLLNCGFWFCYWAERRRLRALRELRAVGSLAEPAGGDAPLIATRGGGDEYYSPSSRASYGTNDKPRPF